MDKLIILIPAFNELSNLKKILNLENNFLVIDDQSTDGTETYLKKKKINYLKNSKNIGYEASILKGFRHIIKNYKNCKVICTIDGDNEHPKKEIKKIYNYFLKNNLDLLVCNRKKKNRIIENFFSFFFNLRFKIKDPLTGMKFYKLKSLNSILNKINNKNFLVDIVYYFIKKKLKVENYQIFTNQNIKNSKIGHSFRVNLKVVKLLKYLI